MTTMTFFILLFRNSAFSFPQLSQVDAGRVNRFAPRGLSQYADNMQQF
jgi:hypothetical protein